jgi:hypothetical protein
MPPQGYQVEEQPQRQQRPVVAKSAPKTAKRRGGGWWVALQFIIGILVIAGVAAAIVFLYVRYYT